MDDKKKLDVLKESREAGVVGKDEYEKLKNEIEPEVKKIEEKQEDNKEEHPEDGKSSEKYLAIAVVVIAAVLLGLLALSYFRNEAPKTIDDLHDLNIKGKLNPSEGYVYKGAYSFVFSDGVWYTQLKSPKGTKVYDLALRFSPIDVANITIEGFLDAKFFNNKTEYYATFDPKGKDFKYIALGIADFNTHMMKVFEKTPIAACDKNETPCETRPIVTCEDTDKLVIYFKNADKQRAYYNNNCIVIEGSEFDFVKGVDRMLYNLYGMMGQAKE